MIVNILKNIVSKSNEKSASEQIEATLVRAKAVLEHAERVYLNGEDKWMLRVEKTYTGKDRRRKADEPLEPSN